RAGAVRAAPDILPCVVAGATQFAETTDRVVLHLAKLVDLLLVGDAGVGVRLFRLGAQLVDLGSPFVDLRLELLFVRFTFVHGRPPAMQYVSLTGAARVRNTFSAVRSP